MSDQVVFGLMLGALALLVLGVIICLYLHSRGDELGAVDGGRGLVEPSPRVFRQRYECTCGFHGTRELAFPPSHIKCTRCDGVAVARGASEPVT